jgi:dehydrogenase/reductase SDR family protein 1
MPKTTSEGCVAVVTGATRGIGRGIAQALGELGATVWVTGRSSGSGELTVEGTARLVDRAGGHGVPVQCDHGDDRQIAALFERVSSEAGSIDVLVNNVFKIPDPPVWSGGFWQHPVGIWDDQVGIGLRAHYVASWHAAPLLFAAAPGSVILNVSSPGGQSYHFSASYGAGKAGLDRLTADMALELHDHGVAAVALYPGWVATEFAANWADRLGRDLSTAQTPLLVGRTAAALVSSPDILERSGTIQRVDALAVEFGITEERQPANA